MFDGKAWQKSTRLPWWWVVVAIAGATLIASSAFGQPVPTVPGCLDVPEVPAHVKLRLCAAGPCRPEQVGVPYLALRLDCADSMVSRLDVAAAERDELLASRDLLRLRRVDLGVAAERERLAVEETTKLRFAVEQLRKAPVVANEGRAWWWTPAWTVVGGLVGALVVAIIE